MHRTGPCPENPEQWIESETKARHSEDILRRQFGELSQQLGERVYFCSAFSVADISLVMAVHYNMRLGGPSLGSNAPLLK
jgi:glutathione S-transferase